MARFAVEYDEYLWPPKDPDVTTDYGIDVSDIVPADDSIATAVWTVNDPVTKFGGPSNNGLQSSHMLGGGTNGAVHEVEIFVTTVQGREVNRTMRLPIEQKKG